MGSDPILFQGVDVGDDVGDGLVVGQVRGDGTHLGAIDVTLVGAAQSCFVVSELCGQVPVRARGQGGRLQCRIAFAAGTVTGGAGLVELPAMRQVPDRKSVV